MFERCSNWLEIGHKDRLLTKFVRYEIVPHLVKDMFDISTLNKGS